MVGRPLSSNDVNSIRLMEGLFHFCWMNTRHSSRVMGTHPSSASTKHPPGHKVTLTVNSPPCLKSPSESTYSHYSVYHRSTPPNFETARIQCNATNPAPFAHKFVPSVLFAFSTSLPIFHAILHFRCQVKQRGSTTHWTIKEL